MGLVTVFWRLRTTGPGETLVQIAGETRLVVDCKVNPAALVGQVRMTFALEGMIVSWGGMKRLNTVPLPALPPPYAVPYTLLPDNIKPADGLAPSLLVPLLSAVKLCRVVKPVPLPLTSNTVPPPKLPPACAIPYKVLPDKTKPADGPAPSLLIEGEPASAVKLYRVVKPVPLVLRANTVPLPELPPALAVPYRVSPDRINPANGLAPSLLV